MRNRPGLVFVGHTASRTGAPAMLLEIVRWFRANSDREFRVVLLDGGPLVDDFRAVAPTDVLAPTANAYLLALARKVLLHARLDGVAKAMLDRRIRRVVSRSLRGASFIYANSGDAARVVNEFAPPGCARVVHLHEMELGMRCSMGPAEVTTEILNAASQVIVASERVLRDVKTWHPDAVERCTVIHSCIDVAAVQASGAGNPDALRASLGIRPGARVVVGCGTLEWRKAPDLFIVVASRVVRRFDGPVHFLWVGGEPTIGQTWEFELDAHRAGLDREISFVPSVANAAEYLALSDVFLLTSREDPFPLVCLEAAALGAPIVCFESSGATELIRDDAGVAVPHLDLTAMADAVVDLLGDDARRAQLGETARQRVWTYDVSVSIPQIAAHVAESLPAT